MCQIKCTSSQEQTSSAIAMGNANGGRNRCSEFNTKPEKLVVQIASQFNFNNTELSIV
jgi:hypothetical protein